MENKEIYIDGVDVSGCCQYMPRYMEDYDIDTLDYCGYHFKPCKDVDVKYCYYKQLKRAENQIVDLNKMVEVKEQECETQQKALELQKSFLDHNEWKLKRAEQRIVELNKTIKAKEQECEELRQARKDLPDIQMPYVILYRQTKAQCYKLEQELKRAEQKLEKIKDYCEEQNLKADWTACEILKIIEE